MPLPFSSVNVSASPKERGQELSRHSVCRSGIILHDEKPTSGRLPIVNLRTS